MTALPERSLPRYAPETPLPRIAYVPGWTIRPEASDHAPHSPHSSMGIGGGSGEERVAALAAAGGFRHGVDLFNHGFYWEAHEAWEELWLPIPRDEIESALLQGLIQAAAALLKLKCGDPTSADTIWERGRARLVRVAENSAARRVLGSSFVPLLAALDGAIERGEFPEPPPIIRLA